MELQGGGDASTHYDCIVVGSGINGLVCAAMLGRKGHRVLVLEREEVFGGCIRSGEITLPGYVHDLLSGFHPLFVTSPGYAELGDELHARGLAYANQAYPTGVLMSDGRSLVMSRDRVVNIAAFDSCAPGDGTAFDAAMGAVASSADLTFSLLGNDLWTGKMIRKLAGAAWDMGPSQLATYFGEALASARDWLEGDFASDELRALLAPWVLHTGLGPDQAASGYMAKVIAFSLETAGMPVVVGGSARLVEAFHSLIEAQGGTMLNHADVSQVTLEQRRASGVTLSDGRHFSARKGVFCSVTPDALYSRMLPPDAVPASHRQKARDFRFGRADMQIHLALARPVPWPNEKLARTAMVHLSDGIDEVSRAVTLANAGLLPDRPTVVVGQPTANDPSRTPEGKGLLWLQLQELPRHVKGDAAGRIAVPADGSWTPALAEAYADRVIERLDMLIPGTRDAIVKRVVLSPADIEAMNCNLVGGDPYAGDCALDQSFLWRPVKISKNHRTPINRLYHIGASTHPGPGLGGVSGFIAASYV